MKTEQQYADELIEKYRMRIGSRGFTNFKSVCIECAKIDVQNTIDALSRMGICDTLYYNYYTKVLTILNDMK